MHMTIEFIGNDREYLAWLTANPTGYVVNTRSVKDDASYMVLHRASCWTISRTTSFHYGGFTERAYKKVCSETVKELQQWVSTHGRHDGSFSKRCGICGPE